VGSAGDGYEAAYKEGIDAVMPLAPGPITLEECQAHAAELVTAATQRAFRMMALGKHASRSRRQ
jgi:glycerate 2-kinase